VPLWQVPKVQPPKLDRQAIVAELKRREESRLDTLRSPLRQERGWDRHRPHAANYQRPRPVLAIFITYGLCFSILGIALTQLKSPLTPPESGVVSSLVDARKASLGPLAVPESGYRGATCAWS